MDHAIPEDERDSIDTVLKIVRQRFALGAGEHEVREALFDDLCDQKLDHDEWSWLASGLFLRLAQSLQWDQA